MKNAEVVDRIEKQLHLFQDKYYGDCSLYPKEWEGKLAESRHKRETPAFDATTMVFMAAWRCSNTLAYSLKGMSSDMACYEGISNWCAAA